LNVPLCRYVNCRLKDFPVLLSNTFYLNVKTIITVSTIPVAFVPRIQTNGRMETERERERERESVHSGGNVIQFRMDFVTKFQR